MHQIIPMKIAQKTHVPLQVPIFFLVTDKSCHLVTANRDLAWKDVPRQWPISTIPEVEPIFVLWMPVCEAFAFLAQ